MQIDLQYKLSQLEDLIKIQRDSLENGYMHGILNGLICAHSVFSNSSPNYASMYKDRKNKVRHKLCQKNYIS